MTANTSAPNRTASLKRQYRGGGGSKQGEAQMKKKRAENGEERVCSARNEDGVADGKPRLQYVMD